MIPMLREERERAEERMVQEYERMNDMQKRLTEDMELMEEAMCKVRACPEIWQNQIIWAICKAVLDMLRWVMRRENEIQSKFQQKS